MVRTSGRGRRVLSVEWKPLNETSSLLFSLSDVASPTLLGKKEEVKKMKWKKRKKSKEVQRSR